MRNAHRYYSEEDIAKMDEEDSHEECEVAADSSDVKNNCKEVNQKLCLIRTLKRQNRIREQQELVMELKQKFGSY